MDERVHPKDGTSSCRAEPHCHPPSSIKKKKKKGEKGRYTWPHREILTSSIKKIFFFLKYLLSIFINFITLLIFQSDLMVQNARK